MSQTFHCPNCGAPLDYSGGDAATIRCQFCQSTVIVPVELRQVNAREPVLSPLEALVSLPELALGMREAAQLTRSGQKEEAIQTLRRYLSISQQEAAAAVDQIERGEAVHLTHLAANPSSGLKIGAGADLEDILGLLQDGNKIEAIKIFRDRYQTSLKESKDAVEAIESSLNLGQAVRVGLDGEHVKTALKGAAVFTGGISCMIVGIVAAVVVFAFAIILLALSSSGGPLEEFGLRINPLAKDRLLLSFGQEGSGQGYFEDPRGLAVDGQGHVFVADFDSGRIQRFDAQGSFLNLWSVGEKTVINALAADRQGRVYAAYKGDIAIFDGANGERLGTLTRPEEIFYYDDIRVTADGGLVALASGETLLRFDSSGELVWMVEDVVQKAANDTELSATIAVDGLGNIYLVGHFTNSVFKFSPEGQYITRWGSDGDGNGQFRAPGAIAVDGRGRVYVSDMKGVQVFENDGRYVRTIPIINYAHGLAIDDQGNLWAATNTPKVFQYAIE